MKTRNIIVALLITVALSACKNDAKITEESGNKEELKPTFDVSFNLVIPKDDTFQLFYTEDGTLNFSDQNSVRSVVKGNSQSQEVLFKLPADVLPTNVRLDFGENPEQDNIVVNSMKFMYLNNSYLKVFGPSENISHYFYAQESQIKLNDKTHTVELLKPKGQPHDPLMWSNQLLSDEIVKLYKK